MQALVRLAAQFPYGIFDLFGDDIAIALCDPAKLTLGVKDQHPAHVPLATDSTQIASHLVIQSWPQPLERLLRPAQLLAANHGPALRKRVCLVNRGLAGDEQ